MSFSQFLKKRWIILLAAVLVLSGGIFAAVRLLGGQDREAQSEENTPINASEDQENDVPQERVRINLSALLTDKTGVKTESGFKLTFPKGTKPEPDTIKEGLVITPSIDYDLESSGDDFVIKPKKYLQANAVYTFKVDLPRQAIKETWAFQTRREFKVVASLPADRGINVPINTGIEITFSHANVQGFDKNFSIEPKVDGRFEMHKNIAVFVPSALQPDTIYTVTIGKGVSQADSGESLKEDYCFSFQTLPETVPTNNSDPYLSVYDSLYNFPSDIQPAIEINASRDFEGKPLDIAVYRYENAESFIHDYDMINRQPSWAIIDRSRYMPDVSGQTPIKSYQLPLTFMEDAYGMAYLALPESLSEGHYLLTLASGNLKDYAFIQVNDMQLYMNIGDKKTLIWINDLLTGQPVQNAVFDGNGIQPVRTAADGTELISEEIFKDSEGRTVCFKAVREGHPPLIATVYNAGDYWSSGPENTDLKSDWSNLYLDRSFYLPSDTVYAWGFLRPRNGDDLPKSLPVNLVKYVYDPVSYNYSKQILETKEVPLTARGTFTADFKYENLPIGSYYIEVEKDGVTVQSSYFLVRKYVKSQYLATVKPEYKAYYGGETLKVQAGCEFFEGTPVSGYAMDYFIRRYSDYGTIIQGDLTLDTQGKANISYTLPDDRTPMSWRPVNHGINVSNKNPEETEVNAYASFDVYPRDVMAEAKIDFDNGTAQVKFTTSMIDISPIRETGDAYNGGEEPLYKGASVDRAIKVTLFERYWDKRENGEYYDIISKQKVKTYEYFEVRNALQTYEVQTAGGAADLTISIPDYSRQKLYTIEYETTDTKGRPILEEAYLSDYGDFMYGYGYYEDYYYLDFEDEEANYKTGEPVNFTMKKNNNEPIVSGSMLYIVLQEGVKTFWTSQSVEQSHVFYEDYIPDAFIMGIYYDGKYIHTTYEHMVRFDSSDKELNMTLETDKASYRPGDTVNAVLTVRDKAGNPVRADVNLSVVDEAYFAMFGQNVDTLASLYRSVFDPGIKSTYVSYRSSIRGQGGAEGEGEDGGGENGVRRNFVDTACFESAETNSHGQAKMSFRLPDNLTSWRLTYQGFTEDLKAGSGTMNITTKLPFFVTAAMNDTYLIGDSPKLLVKAYGNDVKQGDEIGFNITVKGEKNGVQKFEGKGKAGEYTEIVMPALEEGMYTVTVEGKAGKLKDAVERTLQVRKSLLLAKQVDYHALSSDLKLDGIESYSVLSFYNAGLNDYYRALLDLYWNWGNRLDQVAARNISQELLKKYFPEDYYTYGEKADISRYQKTDGGFALLPYGSSDVELTAKMAALLSEEADIQGMTAYFRSVADDPNTTPLQVSAAYYGLASLREPVLLELQSIMTQDKMTLDERLYQANALAVLGDLANAEKIYEEISKDYGKAMEPYLYIDDSGNKDDILRWTSLMAILAVRIDSEDKMAYFNYIEHNSPDEILINLERLILVKQGLPHVSRSSSFIIEVDGKKETIKLEETKPVTMMLSPEKLKTVNFSGIKGDAALSVSYEKLAEPASNSQPIASIARSYNKKNSSPVTIKRTDLVTVELDIVFSEAAPEGFYEVTDVLPSGLRYIYPYQADVDEWYFGEPDGQKVKLGIYYDGGKRERKLVYNARVSAPGEYTADYAMVKHSESDSCGYSQRARILIE